MDGDGDGMANARLTTHPCGAKLDLKSPRPIRFESFAAPAIRIFSDVAEGPANRCPVRKLSRLHDVFATSPPDQFSANAVVRIEPVYPPGLDGRVVNPKGRAIPVGEFARRRPAIRPARVDEHVLHGTAFQHPGEMRFAGAVDDIAFVIVTDEVEFPASNQSAIGIR